MALEIERKFLVTGDSYKEMAFHSDRIAWLKFFLFPKSGR